MDYEVKSEKELCKTPYLTLRERNFTCKRAEDTSTHEGKWIFVERTKKEVAVVIIPYIRETDEIILIKQFRYPFQKYVIEFPAGLSEKGEGFGETALRELKEETGLTGKILFDSPLLAISPGLTTEMATYFIVEVNKSEQHAQNLDCVENIEVFRVSRREMNNFCDDMMKKEDCIIDCKVYLSSGILDNILGSSLCKQ